MASLLLEERPCFNEAKKETGIQSKSIVVATPDDLRSIFYSSGERNNATCDYMCGGGSSCGHSCGRCGDCSCACSSYGDSLFE